MSYEIKCDFCHKTNTFDEVKLNKNKKIKILYCSHCGRAIVLQYNGEKFYETIDL